VKKNKKTRDAWLCEAEPLLKAAAEELKKANALGVPEGETDDKLDFQIAVLAEEVGDVYTRLGDLAERVKLETQA
jgi:hypothetical protein